MSRTLSPSARRAMYGLESNDDLAVLLKLSGGGLDAPIYLTDNAVDRLSAPADGEITYGLTSGGIDHIFLPMTAALPTDSDDSDGSWQVEVHDVVREVVRELRQATGPLSVDMSLVMVSEPDVVEAEFPDYKMSSFKYDAAAVTCQMGIPDDSIEPVVAFSFTENNFPGLF